MGAIGEGGIFRYRYYVYVAWLAFSIIMPSLAFLNDSPAYTAQGTFCYLPVRFVALCPPPSGCGTGRGDTANLSFPFAGRSGTD